jgi:hypothetical protein
MGSLAQRTAPNFVADALCHELTHWGSWGRIGAADREAIASLTELPAVGQALKSRISSGVVGPLARLLSEVGRVPSIDPWLSEIAREAVQPLVRAKAYRCMIEGRMTWVMGQKWVWTQIQWCKGYGEPVLASRELSSRWPLGPTLRVAASDRSAIVRNVAALGLIAHLEAIGDEASELARRLSNDVSPYVAERGRFALERLRYGMKGAST